jgi:hypothetical protein
MLLAFFINVAIVAFAVLIHYEGLERLSRVMPHLKMRYRFRIVIGLLGAILAHVVEIWIFAACYYLKSFAPELFGHLGSVEPDLFDCAYFSFITYTTLGYGDVVPTGSLRFLAGLEALTGLVLITWTASFMYFEMSRYWTNE